MTIKDDAVNEYKEILLNEIRSKIKLNLERMQHIRPYDLDYEFYHGANAALEELAVQIQLVERLGILYKTEDMDFPDKRVGG